MYKVVVKDRGDYGHVTEGTRYCLTKGSATKLAKTFSDYECDFKIFKFMRIRKDIFMWVECNIYNKVT